MQRVDQTPDPATRTNLLLHGVGRPRRELEPGEEGVWISRDQLHRFLDVVMAQTEGEPPTISVDDGNASDVDEVLPALVARGLRATFFPLAGRLDEAGSLSRAAVLELLSAGMRIGTHGMHHRSWRGLPPEQAREEFVTARAVLADLTRTPIDEAACPFGRYDRRSLAALRALGYAKVHTSDGWPSKADAWLQPRYSVRSSDRADDVRTALFAPRPVSRRVIQGAKAIWKRSR